MIFGDSPFAYRRFSDKMASSASNLVDEPVRAADRIQQRPPHYQLLISPHSFDDDGHGALSR